jgi:cellulose synthase/poly-beta-1,6-N-acetylglucosamine synthase-like glycosyltransferase
MDIISTTTAGFFETSETLFFCTAAILLYTWVIYPLVLALLAARRPQSDRRPQEPTPTQGLPFVSLVVAAYNEETAIVAKIRNFLASSYPGSSELLIISDGSDDRTVELASRFIGPRVRLFVEKTNRGKGPALARILPMVRGQIVVFSDATSIFARDALEHLIWPFLDAQVGLVTGAVQVQGNRVAGMYRRYESVIEKFEACLGCISTAHGCIYAVRRSLLQDHDPTLTDDFLQPILVTLQGAGVVVATKALCYEPFSPDRRVQFQRQVRMVALASVIYFRFVPVLLLTRKWRLVFVLTSHKFLRWLTVPMIVALICFTASLARSSALFTVALEAEGLIAALLAVGALLGRAGIRNPTELVWHFMEINFAALLGLAKSVSGKVPSRWSTCPRPLAASKAARSSDLLKI